MKGVRVLVTGADGFIGSHLVQALQREQAQIRALSYYNSFNSWGWLDQIEDLHDVEVVSGDVRDPFFCKDLMGDIEIVFHLAALIGIPYSYIAPDSYVDTNIRGTLNICHAAVEAGCRRVIHTSTSEVYGTALYTPIDEKHPLQPQSPYSASKVSADALAISYHRSFGLPLVIARPFNTYGPRQSARAIVPTIIGQIASGKSEIDLGDRRPTRDFTYVTDTCRAFISLASSDQALGEVVNIGSNSEISVGDLAAKIAALMGTEIHVMEDSLRKRPPTSEVFRLHCDNSKLLRLTDFELRYTLTRGLEETIAWFNVPENLSKYKTGIYNV